MFFLFQLLCLICLILLLYFISLSFISTSFKLIYLHLIIDISCEPSAFFPSANEPSDVLNLEQKRLFPLQASLVPRPSRSVILWSLDLKCWYSDQLTGPLFLPPKQEVPGCSPITSLSVKKLQSSASRSLSSSRGAVEPLRASAVREELLLKLLAAQTPPAWCFKHWGLHIKLMMGCSYSLLSLQLQHRCATMMKS